MELIEGVIQRARQAIVLIPEIALTYQTLLRFYSRFGDRVSVINSTLSAGERYDLYIDLHRDAYAASYGGRNTVSIGGTLGASASSSSDSLVSYHSIFP